MGHDSVGQPFCWHHHHCLREHGHGLEEETKNKSRHGVTSICILIHNKYTIYISSFFFRSMLCWPHAIYSWELQMREDLAIDGEFTGDGFAGLDWTHS